MQHNIFFSHTDEEFGERSVFVSLDGIQSELILIDHPSGEMSVSKNVQFRFKIKIYLF